VANVIDLPNLDRLRDEQRALRALLRQRRWQLISQFVLEIAALATIVLAATAAVLVLLDWLLRLGLAVRILLLSVSLVAIAGYLGAQAVRRWRASRLDELSLAIVLDRFRPGVGQQIADVLQLPELIDEPAIGASVAMVRLAVGRASTALAESDWRSLWNRRRTAAHSGILLLGVLLPVLWAWFAPQAARLSVARWLLGSNERWPQRTYLTVMGLDARGRLVAPRDEPFVMEVRTDLPLVEQSGDKWVVRGRDERLALRQKPAASLKPRGVYVRERVADGTVRAGSMLDVGAVAFRYEFPPSSPVSTFSLAGGDDWLGPIVLERVDRPSLAATRLKVKEPGATYEGFRDVGDPRQHLLFLPDTEVELTLIANEKLDDTQLKLQPETQRSLKRIDERTFTAGWTLRQAVTLEIVLKSAQTGLSSRPAFLSLGILKDREPRVALRALGVGAHITPVATIPLSLAATDDFGLGAVRLRTERTYSTDDHAEPKTDRATVAFPVPANPARAVLDHQVRHEALLQSNPPKVGTLLRFIGEADDRCARGVQTGRSSALALQVVSPDELFYEILIRQRAERTKFIPVLEATEKQSPVLAGNPTADDYLAVMRQLHSGSRQLDQIASRIADTLQEMKLNQIGSPKSHRLLQEGVIDPLQALTSGPMNQLRGMLQALAGSGATGNATKTAGASKDAARRLHQETVTKMRNILEQMSQWESFVDVVNQVAEVIKMQQKVLQETEKARDSRTKEVFDEDKP
jgi:hypothetical protein